MINKTPLGEAGCLGNTSFFTGCSSIQFFNSFLSLSQLALVCLKRRHSTSLVSKCFPPNPNLGK